MATITIAVAKAIPDIVSKAMAIDSQLMQVRKNKKSCACLADRVKAVVYPLEDLANQGVKEEVVQKALDVVNKVLEEAEMLMKNYENTNWLKKICIAGTLKEDFEEVNLHLTEAAQYISLCLLVDQHRIMKEGCNKQTICKNDEDMKIDEQESEECKASSKVIPDIVSKGMAIYSHLMQVKKNKKSCARLADCVKAVVDLLEVLDKQGVDEEVVQKALDVSKISLEEAEPLMEKYEKTHWLKKTFNADTLNGDFTEVNLHLTKAARHLRLCLQVYQQKILKEEFSERILEENDKYLNIDEQESEKCKASSKVIPDIISKGMAIHSQLMQVRKNKKSCARLADHVKAVVDPLEDLAYQGVKEEVVQKALDVFNKALEEAEMLMKNDENTNWIKMSFNADTLKVDFEEVNRHLTEAARLLCLCLQVEQRNVLREVFDMQEREKVFKIRCELINGINEAALKTLLDDLQKPTSDMPPVITGRERNEVLQKRIVTEDQVTCLVDMVRKKGERACERFLSLLKEVEPGLCEELRL